MKTCVHNEIGGISGLKMVLLFYFYFLKCHCTIAMVYMCLKIEYNLHQKYCIFEFLTNKHQQTLHSSFDLCRLTLVFLQKSRLSCQRYNSV